MVEGELGLVGLVVVAVGQEGHLIAVLGDDQPIVVPHALHDGVLRHVVQIHHEDTVALAVLGGGDVGHDRGLGGERVAGNLLVPDLLGGGEVQEDDGISIALLPLIVFLSSRTPSPGTRAPAGPCRRFRLGFGLLGFLPLLLLFFLLLVRLVGDPASLRCDPEVGHHPDAARLVPVVPQGCEFGDRESVGRQRVAPLAREPERVHQSFRRRDLEDHEARIGGEGRAVAAEREHLRAFAGLADVQDGIALHGGERVDQPGTVR